MPELACGSEVVCLGKRLKTVEPLKILVKDAFQISPKISGGATQAPNPGGERLACTLGDRRASHGGALIRRRADETSTISFDS